MGSLYSKNYFEKVHKLDNPERKSILLEDLKFLSSKKSNINKILDVGCGLGEFLSYCDQAGIETFGFDISSFAISLAKNNTTAKLAVLDGAKTKWPYPDDFFDAVTVFDVVEHTLRADNIISEAFRVLKKSGLLFVTTPNGDLENGFFKKILLPYDPTHINVQGENHWVGLLKKAGFRNIKTIGVFSFGLPPSPNSRKMLRKIRLRPLVRPIFCPIKKVCGTLYFLSFKL